MPWLRSSGAKRRSAPGVLAAALFGLQVERPEQFAQALVALPCRERGGQFEQPVFGVALGEYLQQPPPGHRPVGAVQVTGQVAAQLDGLPVLRGGRLGQPGRRGPDRLPLGLIFGFFFGSES